MTVEIKEVQSRKGLRKFIRFPHSLYKNNPYWVPALDFDEVNTLDPKKNPAFEYCETHYWLAYRDNQIVGRIAGIINHHAVDKWNQKYVRFGWIDFVDDIEVSRALLNKVESWAKEKEMLAVHGPLGFTDLDREGMLVEGFDELGTLATNYNHPYYPLHLQQLGYAKDIDWVEYEISVPNPPNETIERMAKISLRRNNLKLIHFNTKKELLKHAKALFNLLEEEYKHLYGVAPLTEKQIEAYIDQYLGFVKPSYVPIVVNENNEMVAFGIVMNSLSIALQRSSGMVFPFGFIHLIKALWKNDRADLYLVAVKSEYQGKGVNAIVMNHINHMLLKHKVRVVESNPELETNTDVQSQWKFFDTRQHKRRTCFIKTL
ncbi:MAG: GNAT family N-acetyltransferase [Anaerolineaceae bacterium]|nr:GNAT family N-acetyltransferase [Anaerolineaceae bacterium]